MYPRQRGTVISVTALVTQNIQPLLVLESIPRPLHAARMKYHRRALALAENRPAHAFPFLAIGAGVIRVSARNPHHVVGTIPGDQVFLELDDLIFRQEWPGFSSPRIAHGARPPRPIPFRL